jgi:2-oxoglutarate ferredoxin oxidoreductase subunit gamma
MRFFGPEMRGGTASCTVIISGDEIGSPVVRNPQAAVVMNLPSMNKYEPIVKPGGVLVVNQSLVNRNFKRKDLQVVLIPANDIAESISEKRLSNMVMIGALLAKMPILSLESVKTALEEELPERHRHLLQANIKALQEGYDFVKKVVQ